MGRKPAFQRGGRPRILPSFFKVLIDDFSNQLRIPPAYKKHLEGNSSNKYLLLSHGRKSWPVEVEKDGNDLFFKYGWRSFMQENCLEMGDFLVFFYDAGASEFFVYVYGRNCCLKEIGEATEKNHSAKPSSSKGKAKKGKAGKESKLGGKRGTKKVMRKAKKQVLQGSAQVRRKRKAHHRSQCEGLEIQDDGQMVAMVPEKAEGRCSSSSISDYPFFQVCIRKGHRAVLVIPAEFSNAYVKEKRGSKTFETTDGMVAVKYVTRGHVSYRFSVGWRAFLRDNKLQEGNTCKFELIDEERLLLKVSIFKSAPST